MLHILKGTFNMKNLIIIFIVFLTAGSCITERKCERRFPQEIIKKDCVVYKDLIREITIHDTLYIQGDTVYTNDTVYMINGLMFSDPVFAVSDYANAKAQVINSKLFLQLVQIDTAIARLIQENVKIKEKEVFKTHTIIKKVWDVHWYDKASRVIAGIFILAIVVLLAMRVIKSYFKPL